MQREIFIGAIAIAVLTGALPCFAQTPSYKQSPADPQGLIRERDESAQRQRQEQLQRSQRELMDRDQAARDARQRLDSLNRALLDRPALPPGAPVAPGPAPAPGVKVDRAEQMRRDEAIRRDRLNYDNAIRALDNADRAVRGASPNGGITGADR